MRVIRFVAKLSAAITLAGALVAMFPSRGPTFAQSLMLVRGDRVPDFELKDLYTRYHKTRGLVVIGVACDTIQGDGIREIEPFVRRFKINYPILLANQPVVDSFGVEALPTTLFIGPDGRVVQRVMGAGRPGELSESAEELMKSGKSGGGSKPAPSTDDNSISI